MVNVIPLLCICYLVHTQLLPSPDEFSITHSLAKCISNSGDLYFEDHEVITVSLAPVPENDTQTPMYFEYLLLSEMHQKQKWLLLVKMPTKSLVTSGSRALFEYEKRSDRYIIQIRTLEGLNEQLRFLMNLPSWNSHAKFEIISMMYFKDTSHAGAYIIKKLWDLDILNSVILFRDGKRSTKFNIFTWFPYKSGECEETFHNIEKIGSCVNGSIQNKEDWFKEKIPNNLNLCPISVRTMVYPPFVLEPEAKVNNTEEEYIFKNGLEIKLLNLVARVANFSIKFSMSGNVDDWGSVQLNGSSTGIIGLLYKGVFDVGVASMIAKVERNLMLDYSHSYFQDSLTYCVPQAEEISQWKKMSDFIETLIYIAIAVIFILNVVLILVVSRINRHKYEVERKAYSNCANLSFKMFALSLGNSITFLPKTFFVRIISICWIILSLHISIAYQTYLMSSLLKTDYEKQVNSLADILDKHLEIILIDSTINYFEESNTYKSWDNFWKLCHDLDQCLNRTAYKQDSAVGTPRLYINFVEHKYRGKENLPLIYCFSQNVVSFPIVMYMRRGFPLRDRINNIINRIGAAGFLKKWQDNLFRLNNFIPDNTELKKNYLSINDLYPVFLVLVVGAMLSSLIFIGEIMYCRHKGKKMY